MKRLIYIIILLLIHLTSTAQDPEFAVDFIHNHSLLNPAYSSKYNFISFNLTTRRQWIYPGSPIHSVFSVSGRKRYMGFGFNMGMSKAAQFYKMFMGVSYFYDVMISWASKTHLSMGLTGDLFQDYLNVDQLNTLVPDPVLQDQKQFSRFYPQVAVGAMVYNDNFEFGMAGLRLLPYSGYFFLGKRLVLPPVLAIHAGYFYRHPIELYDLTTEFGALVSKNSIYFRPNVTIYLKKVLKLGVGLSSKYVFDIKYFNLNAHFNTGLKISRNFVFNYELTWYAVNTKIPTIAKFGNTFSIIINIYPFLPDIPRFF